MKLVNFDTVTGDPLFINPSYIVSLIQSGELEVNIEMSTGVTHKVVGEVWDYVTTIENIK